MEQDLRDEMIRRISYTRRQMKESFQEDIERIFRTTTTILNEYLGEDGPDMILTRWIESSSGLLAYLQRLEDRIRKGLSFQVHHILRCHDDRVTTFLRFHRAFTTVERAVGLKRSGHPLYSLVCRLDQRLPFLLWPKSK